MYLPDPRATRLFHETLTAYPTLGAHVRFIILRSEAGERLARLTPSILGACMNLEAIQIAELQHALAGGDVLPMLATSPARRLAFVRPDIDPGLLIRQLAESGEDAARLEHLHISFSLLKERLRIEQHAVLALDRLERLSLAVHLGHADVRFSNARDKLLSQRLFPFLKCFRTLPRMERLRVFFYPRSGATTALQCGRFVSDVHDLADPRITLAIIDDFDADTLFMYHEHGLVDMWQFGESFD